MIKVFYSASCSSCRKVRKWFDEQKIPYVAKDIFSTQLRESDIREIIAKCENGTEDIISPRSKIVNEKNIDFDSMKISELVDFILKNPSILRRPIIVDDHRVQVGYDPEEIRTFIPRARRMAELWCDESCPDWGSCLPSKDRILQELRELQRKNKE